MSRTNIKVLHVEDNEVDASLVEELLRATPDSRFDIVRVDNLTAGLKLLAKFRVDAVLLDLKLPDSQGLETFRAVSDLDAKTAVLIMTSSEDQEIALQAMREGAQDYLYKRELNSDNLVRAVRYAIERTRIQQELNATVDALQQALATVKALSDLLPICSSCKKVRDDEGYWKQVESYLAERTDIQFSHGVCPDCFRELYPEYYYKDTNRPDTGDRAGAPEADAPAPQAGDEPGGAKR